MSIKNELKAKNARRLRRRRVIRTRIFGDDGAPRLTVFRSHKHFYCQMVDDFRGVTIASASTRHKDVRDQIEGFGGNCTAAAAVGRFIAEKAKALGITRAKFDRNGYKFHGRVKALVEAAREAGLKL